MGLWSKVKSKAKSVKKSAQKALDPLQDTVKAQVANATKGTAIEGVTKKLSKIDFDSDPTAIVDAHADVLGFMFSPEAASVGLAALSGNPAAVASAAGGAKGRMVLAGVQAYDQGGAVAAAGAFGLPTNGASIAATVAGEVGPRTMATRASAAITFGFDEARGAAPGTSTRPGFDRAAWRMDFAARPETVGGLIGKK